MRVPSKYFHHKNILHSDKRQDYFREELVVRAIKSMETDGGRECGSNVHIVNHSFISDFLLCSTFMNTFAAIF
jgi:hypothetical protein